ncbi:glycosyltransferase family 2 protein [Modestobacter roseus]|uniref:glycosyltransferase family 2 protein n=1 Tax=Modestobacter roseus TaxID=1181884 RepID=UPI0034DEE851
MTSEELAPVVPLRPMPGAVPGSGTWCCELDLADAAPPHGVVPLGAHGLARALVRLHGEPLGYLTAPVGPHGVDEAALRARARTVFAEAIADHLDAEGLAVAAVDVPAGAPLPPAAAGCPNHVASDIRVTVVVCTRDRAAVLAGCLERLRALTHPNLEILVVDNAPTDDSTRAVVAAARERDDRVRHVVEPRPGLSAARNRGLAEARGAVLAYTDDDVAVDPDWVQGVLRGFGRGPAVACVTGLVCTAAVDTPAEEYFDARTALWSTRCTPELFDLAEHRRDDPLYPYAPGLFGTGANLSFDRQVLLDLGGFDEALGAGTLTRGGEDLDVFVRVLRAGHGIAYEPAAVVWHHHRADDAALLRQLYGYGTGLSAYLTKCLLQGGTRGEVLRRVLPGLRRRRRIAVETGERLGGGSGRAPAGAARRELLGVAAGPVLYLRARWRARAVSSVGPGR